jgi:predicted methyltransferase
VSIEVINGNLLDPVKRLDGQVDLLIFNPPVRAIFFSSLYFYFSPHI